MKVQHFAAKDCSPPTVKLMQIDHFHTPAEEPACGALQGLSLFSILLTAHIKSCGEFISIDTVESYQLHEV